MSLAFEIINDQHMAKASKDRTGLFTNMPEFVITAATGKRILHWCNSGTDISIDEITERINECKSIGELLDIYKTYPQYKEVLRPEFEQRKRQIIISQEVNQQLIHLPINSNGIH